MRTVLAIEPPRMKSRYAFDEQWYLHTLKCQHCSLETFAARLSEAEAAMDAHLGNVQHATAIGTLTTDI